ncbi:MAG: MFS transporter [Anaerolineales bacterium]|nr:MFS transporter [Anaerolineales bacterium]
MGEQGAGSQTQSGHSVRRLLQSLHGPHPPHPRWNYTMFLIDYLGFGVGFTFASLSSVIPSFVRQMTDSAPLVGLASTVFNGCWTLPQLFVAHLITGKPRKKPVMLAAMPGRVLPLVIAIALWTGLGRHPTSMLILFFTCFGLFAISDGVASVPWYDILGRTIPANRRGRLFGTSQAIIGLLGIGVGALVTLILARQAFPGSYALLFLLWGVSLLPSTAALSLLWEPPAAVDHAEGARAARGWMKRVARDRTFRRLMLCRILFSIAGLATPFYAVHAVDALGLPESIVGTFVIAQTAASIVGSAALGFISERRGTRSVIRVGGALAIASPLYALGAHLIGGWPAQAYPIVFVLLGILNSSTTLGFSIYMLEIAPDELRSAYVGFGNTIMGLLSVMPVVGGWLLQTTSYPVLFGFAAAIAGLCLALSFGLPSTHATHTAASDGL